MNALIERIAGEFVEMPGLRLTSRQVQRLCDVDRTACALVLDALVDQNFLRLNANGTYGRVTDGHQPRGARASARSDRAGRLPAYSS